MESGDDSTWFGIWSGKVHSAMSLGVGRGKLMALAKRFFPRRNIALIY